jgi:hypothetical protein
MNTTIGRDFAAQARIAADDATVSDATLRQGLRDAADLIDTQRQIIEGQTLRDQHGERRFTVMVWLFVALAAAMTLRLARVW